MKQGENTKSAKEHQEHKEERSVGRIGPIRASWTPLCPLCLFVLFVFSLACGAAILAAMYQIRIERTFNASHALRLYDGSVEPSHGHDWQTKVDVQAQKLDEIELVMDFHALERIVGQVLADLHHRDLNQHPAFAGVNPSAERVAEHIYRAVAARLPEQGDHGDQGNHRGEPRAKLVRVTVTEAPGCEASYWE